MKKNNFKSLMQAAVLVCTPLAIVSCDDVFGDTDNPIPSYLTVNQNAVNLELHKDHPANATVTRRANAATGAEIVYSSSNPEIATVDAAGKVTAVNGGNCWIYVQATGKDSNGRTTYQEAKDSFEVIVTDHRAQIKFAEEGAIVNSALIENNVFKFKQSEVYPKTASVTYTPAPATGAAASTSPVQSVNPTTGQITLKAGIRDGVSVITAKMTDPNDDAYEMKSFGDGTKVEAKFTLTIKEGVAYISGYDAEGEAETTYIYKNHDGQSYTKLSTILPSATADVALAAGTYYLDQDIDFAHNIRIKGDVNLILGRGNDLNLTDGTNDFSILDESASQSYKLNIFTQPAYASVATDPGVGTLSALRIKDFKEVNLCGGSTVTSPVDAVENVTINRGGIAGNLTGTGNVNVTDAYAGNVKGFATVTVAKAKNIYGAGLGSMESIGTAIISENTYAAWGGTIKGVTNLTIDKAAHIGNIGAAGAANKVTNLTINEAASIDNLENIGTATITKTTTKVLKSITDLTLDQVDASNTNKLELIGTVTIKSLKTGTTANFTGGIQANTVNIIAGTIAAKKVVGHKAKTGGGTDPQAASLAISGGALTVNNSGSTDNYAIFGDITMTGGALTVTGPAGEDNFAVRGNVNVATGLADGKFQATGDYHAVSGTLTGNFVGSTNGTTWTAISGSDKPKYVKNKKAE